MIGKRLFVLLACLFVVMIGFGITLPVLPFYVERLARAEGATPRAIVMHVALLTAAYQLPEMTSRSLKHRPVPSTRMPMAPHQALARVRLQSRGAHCTHAVARLAQDLSSSRHWAVAGSDLIRLHVTIAKRRYDVSLTAFGHLAAQDLRRTGGFPEKFGRRLDHEPSGMRLPRLCDARVNVGRNGG